MAKEKELLSNLLGGQFLSNMKMTGQWLFVFYVFILLIAIITVNLKVAETQIRIRRNQKELKNLKADYTSKYARLQYQSKQGEIEIKLLQKHSDVKKPVTPATYVELPK